MKMRLNLDKNKFAEKNAGWLGFNLSQTGKRPLKSKFQGITDRLKPKLLEELRSFLGAVNQMNRFIPNLAQHCFPFPPLLKNGNSWDWRQEHDKVFFVVKDSTGTVVKVTNFKRTAGLKIICDGSRTGLSLVLQQREYIH